jgi:transcription elongation factor Elf1
VIIKEVDSTTTTDKFSKAGLKAEERMAFYLSREFKDTKDILVLNGIRLESDNDSAQIDHLIIHKYGMIIIESKSVVGTIEINDYGEWHRLVYKVGMASPIEQAKRQEIFLKRYLNESGLKPPHNAFKSLVHKITFDDVRFDVLVAISDTGIIKRPKTLQIDNVLKAEMIGGKIKEIIASYRKQDSIWSSDLLKPPPLKISPETMSAIARFLKEKHVSKEKHARLQVKQDKIIFTAPAPVNRKFTCQECGSENIIILYGRFGYYFKCKGCNKTMSIKEHCPKCGQLSKLRKDRNQFYIECKKCNTSTLFFKNTN